MGAPEFLKIYVMPSFSKHQYGPLCWALRAYSTQKAQSPCSNGLTSTRQCYADESWKRERWDSHNQLFNCLRYFLNGRNEIKKKGADFYSRLSPKTFWSNIRWKGWCIAWHCLWCSQKWAKVVEDHFRDDMARGGRKCLPWRWRGASVCLHHPMELQRAFGSIPCASG